jgi:hypothetical protein
MFKRCMAGWMMLVDCDPLVFVCHHSRWILCPHLGLKFLISARGAYRFGHTASGVIKISKKKHHPFRPSRK